MVRHSHQPHPLAGVSGSGLPIAPPGWHWRCGPKIKDMTFSCVGSPRIRSRGQLAAFLLKTRSQWGIDDFNWTPTLADVEGSESDEDDETQAEDQNNQPANEDDAPDSEDDVVVDDEDQARDDKRQVSDEDVEGGSSCVRKGKNVPLRTAAKLGKEPERGADANIGKGYPMPLAAAYPPDYRRIEFF